MHGLGSDVPLKNLDRTVSPFAMQLKYDQCVDITSGRAGLSDIDSHKADDDYIDTERLGEFQESEFENLRNTFQDLGHRMIELGCRLARVCDGVIGGHELEQSLRESCTAKGRLIHYHSTLDNFILKESSKRKGSTKGRSNDNSLLNGSNGTEKYIRDEQTSVGGHGTKSIGYQSNLWQQWHYDYGIFTVLTDPMFMLPYFTQTTNAIDCSCISCEELPSPSGHSYLQIYHLNKNSVLMVKVSPDSFIVQVGESADILSKGKLRATLHSVGRPPKQENLSRETFVVFLQPAWSKTFSLLDYPVECSTLSDWQSGKCTEEIHAKQDGKLTQEIYKIVPPLSARLKDGMTFAEFSRETTKQYYGDSGLQSKG